MRRAWAVMVMVGAAVMVPAARGEGMLIDGPMAFDEMNVGDEHMGWNGRWRGRRYGEMDERQLRSQIQSIVGMQRASGMDDWAWHNAVEDQLVGFGQTYGHAVPLIWRAAEGRTGFELSALEVAAFRLANGRVNPREAAAAWGRKNMGVMNPGVSNLEVTSGSGVARAEREEAESRRVAAVATGTAHPVAGAGDGVKVKRVMGLNYAFPHHLFYVVETQGPAKKRMVVAVAADNKVQAISDDAALARFLRVELPAIHAEAGWRRVAGAAAMLGLSREVTIFRVEEVAVNTQTQTVTAEYSADGHRVKARVTFDDGGKVAAVSMARESAPPVVVVPVLPPNPTAVPAMPE